jgi:PKD repeat protein
MKKTIVLLTLAFLFCNYVNAQTWQWARSAGGNGYDYMGTTATDPFGNVYVTGSFASTITFGTTTLTSAGGSTDIFLAKYDSSGNALWAKRAGGTNVDLSGTVCCDAWGNVYIAGYFLSNSITFGTTILNRVGFGTDMFVAKYDSSGNVLWAQRAGGTADDGAKLLTTDAAGALYMASEFASDTVTFGSTILVNTNSFGFLDVSITKFDSSGNALWAKKAGGSGDMYAYSFATDVSGNVFVAGSFYSSSITFGTTTLFNSDATETTQDLYIAKYSTNGNFLWARTSGGNWDDGAMALAPDVSGNVYIGGFFDSDSIMFSITTLMNADTGGYGEDLFVAKYDDNGIILWAKRAGMQGGENANSIITNGTGNFYLAGYFSSDSLSLGSVTLHNDTVNTTDFFIAKYDSSGNTLWGNSVGSTGGYFYTYQTSMTSDTFGNIYVGGGFQSVSVVFGSDTLNNTGPGSEDIFIVKVNDDLTCSASFNLFPDTSTLHNYWAVNYASGALPLQYDWDWGDGGPHDATAYPSHTYAAAGYYTICLTIADAVSCTNTVCQTNLLQVAQNSSAPVTMVQVNVVSSIPTGVSLSHTENNISISPNPVSEEIILHFDDEASHLVIVCSALGEVLFERTMKEKQGKINMRNFPKGIYFVSVKDEKNNLMTKKIVKI